MQAEYASIHTWRNHLKRHFNCSVTVHRREQRIFGKPRDLRAGPHPVKDATLRISFKRDFCPKLGIAVEKINCQNSLYQASKFIVVSMIMLNLLRGDRRNQRLADGYLVAKVTLM